MLYLSFAAAFADSGAVCVFRATVDDANALSRLSAIGESPVLVEPGVELSECGLAVLPSSWFEKRVLSRATDWSGWIEQGGRALVFQPNPFPEPDTVRISLLGPSFSVHSWYDVEDVRTPVAEHPILRGLERDELPFPTDRILSWDPPFQALVIGSRTESASLLALQSGCGRALVVADNPLRVVAPPAFSDRFLAQALAWLREPGDCTPAGAPLD